MGILETIIIILCVVVVLVVSHEFGHFASAKWFGIRVEEFGIGIPPKLFGIKRGETEYTVNLLPLGGFVRIFGEDTDVNDPRSFSSRGFWVRSFIVAAGVIANIIVAYLLFTAVAFYGTPIFGVSVAHVVPGSPAALSGFEEGDVIKTMGQNHEKPVTIADVQSYIDKERGKEVEFIIQRKDREVALHSVPRIHPPAGEGAIGVVLGLVETGLERSAWYRAPLDGFVVTVTTFRDFIVGLGLLIKSLFVGSGAPGEVIGPVGIAIVADQTFHVGLRYFVQLIALLSLNLALINILPIPALDGGRILFFIIEKIRGKNIPARTAGMIHSAFFLLLIGFLLWVTYQDILRLI